MGRKHETMCPACELIVGVYPPFGTHRPSWKIPRHHDRAGRWCRAAGWSIPQAAAIPTRVAS